MKLFSNAFSAILLVTLLALSAIIWTGAPGFGGNLQHLLAEKTLLVRAATGNADAQMQLGMSLLLNPGREPEGEKWLSRAAEQGLAEAQYKYGGWLDSRKKTSLAVPYLEKAAKQNHVAAARLLATIYLTEEKTFPGFTDGQIRLLTEAAEKNDDKYVRYTLAQEYLKGVRLQKSLEKSAYWYKKLVEQGAPYYYDYAFVLSEIDPVKHQAEIIALLEKEKALNNNPRIEGLLLKMKGGGIEKIRQSPRPQDTSRQQRAFSRDCVWLSKPVVDLEIVYHPVAYDHSKTAQQITERANPGAGNNAYSRTVGAHLARPQFQPVPKYHMGRIAGDSHCLALTSLKIKVLYASTIHIASEYPQGSCKYENIRRHELRHRKIDEDIYREYEPTIEAYISDSLSRLPPIGPASAADIKEQMTARAPLLGDKISEGIALMRDEIFRRNVYIDTPQEYSKTDQSCD